MPSRTHNALQQAWQPRPGGPGGDLKGPLVEFLLAGSPAEDL